MARAQAAVAKAANLPAAQVTVHNHMLGGGFGRRLEADMVYDAARIAKQVDGPGQSRVDAGRGHPPRLLPSRVPHACSRRGSRAVASSAGSTRSPALPCSRAGCRRSFRRASIPTASTRRRTFPTTSRTIASSSTARSRRASTRPSGAAWARTTTCSRSSRSSTSSRARRARIRSRSGARISTRCRACRQRSTW